MSRTAAKPSTPPAPASEPAGYASDFFAWTHAQAQLLREGRFSEIDIENIAEELETLGRSQRREIRNRLLVLLVHLLKWHYQAGRRSTSWRATIVEQRKELLHELKDSPSLRRYPAEVLEEEHQLARLKASGETKLPLKTFPDACPFTVEQILDPDFLPDESAA